MKKFRRLLIVALVLLAIAGGGFFFMASGQEESYQRDADAKRVNDVHKIAALLNEYRQATGHYPFNDPAPAAPGMVKVPTMVTIGMPSAEEELAQRPNPFGISVGRLYSESLGKELEKGLGKKVALPFDPQKVPTVSPNAYYAFFMADADRYVVICFLYAPTEYSTPVAPHVNVYAVSSDPDMQFLGGMGVKPRFAGGFDKAYLEKVKAEGERADKVFDRIFSVLPAK